nr:GNAT family N-acetyltransferase [Clostridium psychrophilum]
MDNETNNMMWEPGETKTTIEEMNSNINNISGSKSLRLVVEDKGNIIGFLSSERGFAKRISHRAYIVIGILKDYRGKKIGVKLF